MRSAICKYALGLLGGVLFPLVNTAISEPLYNIHGGYSYALYGTSLADAGDFNGDGVNDFAVGAPSNNLSLYGRVYIISGKDRGVLKTYLSSQQNDGFGASVKKIGDLNGDGKPEFAIGATGRPHSCPSGSGGTPSYVAIVSGANGAVLRTITGSRGSSLGSYSENSIQIISDLDSDQKPDLLLAEPKANCNYGNNPCRLCQGAVYIYSSGTGALLRTITGQSYGEEIGKGLGVVGDISGDQKLDFGVSFSSSQTTKVYSGTAQPAVPLFTYPAFFNGISRIGDSNGDGLEDFAMGGGGAGVKVYSGFTGGLLYTISSPDSSDLFGQRLAPFSDYNGDGRSDFLASSSLAQYVHLVSGANGQILKTYTESNPGRAFGAALLGTIDLNGDSKSDVIIGAPQASTRGLSLNGFVSLPYPAGTNIPMILKGVSGRKTAVLF